jgi:hypothetical protein
VIFQDTSGIVGAAFDRRSVKRIVNNANESDWLANVVRALAEKQRLTVEERERH